MNVMKELENEVTNLWLVSSILSVCFLRLLFYAFGQLLKNNLKIQFNTLETAFFYYL